MNQQEAVKQGLALVEKSNIAMLGTNGPDGYPHIRAMIKMETEDLKTIWFTTNTPSPKIAQLKQNPKACVYFVDFDNWMGLTLIGTVEILQDPESKQRLWRDGFEKYYPQGVNDPDYSVLRFTTQQGEYYHALSVTPFEL